MKKMNNKGWGLAQMLIMSGAILLALLVAACLIYYLYSSLGLT